MGGLNHDNARCHTTWYVYRLYAANGLLLYVGKTYSTRDRLSQHAVSQPWWDEVCLELTRVESYATEATALSAEKYAIRTEHPKYNKIYNQDFRLPPTVRNELVGHGKVDGIVLPPPPDFYSIIIQRHRHGQKLKQIIAYLRQDFPRYVPEIEAAAQRYRESDNKLWLSSQRIAARQSTSDARLPTCAKHMRDIAGRIGSGWLITDAARQQIEITGDVEGVRQACEWLLERSAS